MRRIAMFLPVLCCLAFVAQQSASADETRVKAKDAANDKSSDWKEGSIWEGLLKVKWGTGQESSYAQIIEITKRDGKSFKGRQSGASDNPAVVLEFEGEVDASGMMTITYTKILKAPDEGKDKEAGRNMIGLKSRGNVDGKSVALKMIQPNPDHPKAARNIWTWKLKLKTDD